ncbi:MAG: SulP family inorganic anion transporter [Burkholderiales bacterium]|nr:SulP family inorganic anion transporter [Burkholderiales bacterium]
MPSRTRLARLLPFTAWWSRVDAQTLRADAAAALLGAVVVIPQGIAFATLAGLPPQYGLYCAMVPTAVAALFGSSWHAVTGPTNAVSLFVLATVSPLAAPGSPQYVSHVLTLAFLSGAIMLALGLLRLGRLVNFVSHTVVLGFTAGAATLIVASQLGNFFGVPIAPGSAFVATLRQFVEALPDVQPFVVATGAVTLAAGLLCRRLAPRLPYMIVALVAGGVAAWGFDAWFGAERTGIRTLGALPGAMPPLSAPQLSADAVKALLGAALGVTVLSLTEAMSIARAIALRSGQRLDANQEFVGQGLANLAASFFSGYPVSASFNRSALAYEAGARTPLAAALSAPMLAALLLFVGPLLAHLPVAAMAALLFMVAGGLVDLRAMRAVWRASRSESAVMWLTFAATLAMNLEVAVLAGVTLSLLAYLNRTSRPQIRAMAPDPRHRERRFAPVAQGLAECPQLKIVAVEGSLYFGAVDHFESHMDTLREVAREQRHLLVLARNVNFVDLAGAEALAREARTRRAAGGALWIQGLRQPAEDVMRRSGALEEIGPEHVWREKREAIAHVFERLDRAVCARCRARIFEECGRLAPPV